MPLLNIHVFVDDEVPAAEDFNSIGESVSAEIAGGNIAASSLVWPLVAQGDIDMNGYSITNIAGFFEQYHVNDSFTLQEAIAEVNSAGGGTIVIDPESVPVASNELITANNVSILGSSGRSILTISGTATLYGIKCTGSNFRMTGVQITGGTTLIPCIVVNDNQGAAFDNNTFSAILGPGISFSGSGEQTANARVINNFFAFCSEQAILALNLVNSVVDGNTFDSVDGNNIELGGDADTACHEVVISNNSFSGGDAPCIYSDRSTTSSSFGQLSITGNVMDVTAGNCMELGSYINSAITGNTILDPATIAVQRSTITGNTFNSTLEIDTTASMFCGNSFRGAVTRVSGTANTINSNIFEAAVEIDAAWISTFVGNTCIAGVTVTATDPDVVGLNWGF